MIWLLPLVGIAVAAAASGGKRIVEVEILELEPLDLPAATLEIDCQTAADCPEGWICDGTGKCCKGTQASPCRAGGTGGTGHQIPGGPSPSIPEPEPEQRDPLHGYQTSPRQGAWYLIGKKGSVSWTGKEEYCLDDGACANLLRAIDEAYSTRMATTEPHMWTALEYKLMHAILSVNKIQLDVADAASAGFYWNPKLGGLGTGKGWETYGWSVRQDWKRDPTTRDEAREPGHAYPTVYFPTFAEIEGTGSSKPNP